MAVPEAWRGTGEAADLAGLLRACAAGDRAALRALYDALAPQLLGVAMRILRRRDLAEEALHDCFLRVWQGASGFDPARGEARSWIFAILRHRALNILRADARTELVDDFGPLDLPADTPDPEQVVLGLSEAGALRRCLETLDPVRRNAVVLAYVEGLTHGELAGRLGVPLGTAKSWIRRSLASLRECLS